MQPGLISVVLPVYNGAEYLPQAIESVLRQSDCEVEIVAVDDGSTDESAKILEGYGPPVRIVRQQNSGNVGQVRNVGIEHSRGEYIAFLDQDDWWLPEKLAKQLEVINRDSRIALVHTAVSHYDDSTGHIVGPLNPNAHPEWMTGECYEELLMGNPIYNSSVLVRRTAIERVGSCDETIPGNTVQDYDLWLRIAQQFHFGFVADEVTAYRMHASQGMWDRRKMLAAELELLLRMRDETTWKRSTAGRQRLGRLCDELAVSHYDEGATSEARRWFSRSMRIRPSGRSIARLIGSCLPRVIVERVRN